MSEWPACVHCAFDPELLVHSHLDNVASGREPKESPTIDQEPKESHSSQPAQPSGEGAPGPASATPPQEAPLIETTPSEVYIDMSNKKLLQLLADARWALATDYIAAGGDEEAKVNVILKARRRLIDKLDRALKAAE